MSIIAAAIAGLSALGTALGAGGSAGAAAGSAGAAAAGAGAAATGISKFVQGLSSSFKSLPSALGQGFNNSWKGFTSGNLRDVANFGKSALDMIGLGDDIAQSNPDTDTSSFADQQENQVEQMRKGVAKNFASRQIDFLSRIISSSM